MDKDTEVDSEEVKEEGTDTADKAGYHGYGVNPEHETLIGIYHSTYNAETAVRKIANFIDRVDWYLELLYYGLIGAMIGWAVAKILMLLHLF